MMNAAMPTMKKAVYVVREDCGDEDRNVFVWDVRLVGGQVIHSAKTEQEACAWAIANGYTFGQH